MAEDSTCFVVVTDSLGNTLRQRFFVYERFPTFKAILPLSNGDIVFAGFLKTFSSQWTDVYLARTDSLLNAPPIGIIPIGNEVPYEFALYQNYPNPFNPTTKIEFQVPKAGYVKIVVYDILGREVSIPVHQTVMPGVYEVTFDAYNLSSAIYFYQLLVDGSVIDTKKMILMK